MEGVQPSFQHGSRPRAGDVRHSKADTASAIRDLGHSPRITIEEGLRRTLEWYRRSGSA